MLVSAEVSMKRGVLIVLKLGWSAVAASHVAMREEHAWTLARNAVNPVRGAA